MSKNEVVKQSLNFFQRSIFPFLIIDKASEISLLEWPSPEYQQRDHWTWFLS